MSDLDASVNINSHVGSGFNPSSQWQEIPDGTAVPPGGEFRMETDTGKNYGRWESAAPASSIPPSAVATSQPWDNGRPIWSAPATAPDTFDHAAYEQMRQTGQYVDKPLSAFQGIAAPAPPTPAPPINEYEAISPVGAGVQNWTASIKQGQAEGRYTPPESDPWHLVAYDNLRDVVQPVGSKALANIAEDQKGIAFGAGYTAMTLGSSGSHLAQMNNGQYFTPEQVATAQMDAAAPAAAGMVGTLIGAATGLPGGSLVGQFAGQAAGQLGSAVFGATEERAQSSREIGEMFTAALGEATTKLKDFSAQAEATGAPLKQLQEVLGVANSVAPVGVGAITGAGAMTNALGEYAGANYTSVAGQLHDPTMFGFAVEFGENGRLSQSGYAALGTRAAIRGDAAALYQDNLAAQRSGLADNPAYQQAQTQMRGAEDPVGIGVDLFRAVALHDGGGIATRIAGFTSGWSISHAAETNQQDDPSTKARNELFKEIGGLRETEGFFDAADQYYTSRRTNIGLRGGSANDILAASGEVHSAIVQQEQTLDTSIGVLSNQLATNKDPKLTTYLSTEIETRRAARAALAVSDSQITQEDFSNLFGEASATQGLGITGSQATLTSRLLSGGSYAGAKGLESSLEGSQSAFGSFLSDTASDVNPLNPTQRAGMKARAIQVQQQVAVERYQFAQNLYNEENLSLDITRAERGAGIEHAEFFGSPLDAYNANITGAQNNRDQITQNNSELTRGNLTNAQTLQLRKQNVDLQGQLAIIPEQARRSYYSAEGELLSASQSGDRAGLSRDVGLFGNSAFTTHNVFRDDQARVDNDYRDLSTSPNGSVAQKQAYARWHSDLQEQTENRDSSLLYRQTQSERVKYMRDEGDLHRAEIAPWMDGSPEANPFTRRNVVLGDLQAQLSGAQKALKNTPQDSPAYEANAAKVDQFQSRIAEVQHEKMFDITRLLPEMIAGAGGKGTLSGVLPTAGQSSYFASSPYITGTFGPHAREAGAASGGDHPQMPGGTAGRFMAASGGSGGNDPQLAALNRIASLLEQVTRRASTSSPANLGGNSGGFNAIQPRNIDGARYEEY